MFFSSIKEINRLRKEINRLRKEICRLLNKGMSNISLDIIIIYLQVSFWGASTHPNIIEF